MTVKFTFGQYSDSLYTDWYDVDNRGVDAEAFLLTGFLTGGDTQRNKQVVYQTTHFGKVDGSKGSFFLTSKPFPLYEDFYESFQTSFAFGDMTLSKVLEEFSFTDAFAQGLTFGDITLRPIVQEAAVAEHFGQQLTLGNLTLSSVVVPAAGADHFSQDLSIGDLALIKYVLPYDAPSDHFQQTLSFGDLSLELV